KSAQTKMKEWTFYNESAYEMERYVTDADIITSLSALEHVYKRKKFLRSAKAVLREGGKFFLNYDNGHFLSKSLGEKKRNLIGPYLARLGWENWYQSFVWQNEIIKYLEDLNFIIIEELNFHQATTKGFHRVISDTISKQYHDLWLKYELEINALLKEDKTSLNQANSNRFLLAKLFVLTV
ncbi:methyltransferase domain-containing protein, partial [bacterium]|nr:methyltransferase domain-containing protein [bacterium]